MNYCTNNTCSWRNNNGTCNYNVDFCNGYKHPKIDVEIPIRLSNPLKDLDENITKLEQLTGCSLEELLEKLAAGWTLEPPKKSYTLSDLMKDFGDE